MQEKDILQGYEYAREVFARWGVDTEAAMQRAGGIPVSMQCWQGDDVIGFDSTGELTGGIATTGNYPGRARTPKELRDDIDEALGMIPGISKINLHASYAEKNGRDVDRDAFTPREFEGWMQWAKEKNLGLDFNPTFFSHPMMDGDFSLSSPKKEVRDFWVEHGKRCREIGAEFSRQLGKPCAINFWMPDGYKDVPADTLSPRARMMDSLDAIFAEKLPEDAVVYDAIESKLFGVGVESYTVASHEFSLCYALKNNILYCLDAGHFHPTEVISAKMTAVLSFLDRVLLHVSRPVRWDSDHVITLDDELQRIMDEILYNKLEDRVCVGLDFFDASINRIAAWVIGMRNARKALLFAALAPAEKIRAAEAEGNYTARLALMEERKTLPMGAVWDYFCLKAGVPVGAAWLDECARYEREVLSGR